MQRAGVVLHRSQDLLCRWVRGEQHLNPHNAVDEVGDGVVLAVKYELCLRYLIPLLPGIALDILTVHDALDQSLVDWVIHLGKIGQNKLVGPPVVHPAARDKAVLDIGVARIAGGAVAPRFPAVHVDGGIDSLGVEQVGLLHVQDHLAAVRKAQATDFERLIGQRDIGYTVVVVVGVRDQGGCRRGKMIHLLPHPDHRPKKRAVLQ